MQTPREYRSVKDARQAIAGRLDRAHAPALFDRLDWYAGLHGHCYADVPLSILRAQDGDTEAWLFLLSPRPRIASALANWYSFAWAPVFLGAPDAATRARLLDALARELLSHTARIDLYPMDAPDPMLAALRRAGFMAVKRAMGGRHLLPVDGRSFAEYWAQRPGALRSLVRRKARDAPYALHIERHLTPALWQDYVDVQARSWQSAEPACGVALLRDMAERESAAGALRLGFARVDGVAVATQLWTVERGVALIHKLSHDRAHDAGSPGTLLSHALFRAAMDEDGVDLIDYGTGDKSYKADWMERRVPLYRVDAFNPRHASAWLPAARAAISALVG